MKIVGPALSFPTNQKPESNESKTQVMVKIQNSFRMSTMLEELNQGQSKIQTIDVTSSIFPCAKLPQ